MPSREYLKSRHTLNYPYCTLDGAQPSDGDGFMMVNSHVNPFHVTGPLCREASEEALLKIGKSLLWIQWNDTVAASF